MKYVLQNTDTGKFVSSGKKNSYTERLQNATTYPTREAAQADACGNERSLTLEEAMSYGP